MRWRVVTNGTAEANYISALTVLEPGDEAIVMHPNYMQVRGLAHNLGATVTPLPLHEEQGWAVDPDELKKLVSAPNFRLKGSGWYETDFKKDKRRNLAGDAGKSDGGAKSDTKSTDKSADKSADKKSDTKSKSSGNGSSGKSAGAD